MTFLLFRICKTHLSTGCAMQYMYIARASGAALLMLVVFMRETRADGHIDCPCIGLPTTVPFVDCDEQFAFNGKCVIPPAAQLRAANGCQDPPAYPGDYGSMCKKHFEPGLSQCWNLATGQELPLDQRASWCNSHWCFVDPTNCELPGADSSQPSDSGWETDV